MSTQNEDKTYEAPKLIKYGSLYDLTATGTGSMLENSGNDAMPTWQVRA